MSPTSYRLLYPAISRQTDRTVFRTEQRPFREADAAPLLGCLYRITHSRGFVKKNFLTFCDFFMPSHLRYLRRAGRGCSAAVEVFLHRVLNVACGFLCAAYKQLAVFLTLLVQIVGSGL